MTTSYNRLLPPAVSEQTTLDFCIPGDHAAIYSHVPQLPCGPGFSQEVASVFSSKDEIMPSMKAPQISKPGGNFEVVEPTIR
jgi:hypothetical protein